MESLNLNTLASSLPSSTLQNAEKDLLNNFKAAALSITTLYRSSRHTSKRAYNAGYVTACQDLLLMIQQGVSVDGVNSGGAHGLEAAGMTVGKVMDWIEARLEAIKAREEEEDEDEERERERERDRPKPAASNSLSVKDDRGPKRSTTAQQSTSNASSNETKDKVPPMPTPNSPKALLAAPSSSRPTSPSPPSGTVSRSHSLPQRPSKPRIALKELQTLTPGPSPQTAPFPHGNFSFALNPSGFVQNEHPSTPISTSAKRRHAVMMLESTPPTVSASESHSPIHSGFGTVPTGTGNVNFGLNRRRTRSSKSLYPNHQNRDQNCAISGDAMDVEDDNGREKKRVARR